MNLVSSMVAVTLSLLLGGAMVKTTHIATMLWQQQRQYSRAQTAFLWIQKQVDLRVSHAGDFGPYHAFHPENCESPRAFPFARWAGLLQQKGIDTTGAMIAFTWMESFSDTQISQTPAGLTLYTDTLSRPSVPQWWVASDALGLEIFRVLPQQIHAIPGGWRVDHFLHREFQSELQVGKLRWIEYAIRDGDLYAIEPLTRTQPVFTGANLQWYWRRDAHHLGVTVRSGEQEWHSGWIVRAA